MKQSLFILTIAALFTPLSSLAAIDRSFTVWVTQPSAVANQELRVGLDESFRSLRPEMEAVLVRMTKTAKQTEKSEAGSEIRKRKQSEGKA